MNIYVSHLSFGTSSESLQTLFEQYGEVSSVNIINDRETGRSRGFAFVEMPNDTEGQSALDALNETDFEGRTISVNVARPRTEKTGYSNNRGGGGFNRGGGGGYNRDGYNKKRY